MKILVVEDEESMLSVIVQSLKKENFIVETASDLETAVKKVGLYDYDCILLDVMLGNNSGLKLLEELRALEKSSSVIIISAKDSVDDKIKGLELGADDYLTKPFHLAELHARVKSLLRRKSFGSRQMMEIGNVKINPDQRLVLVNDTDAGLTRKEFDILNYLVLNKNRLVNKSSLAEHVWGDHADEGDNLEFIYSQIKNLRKKLKEHNATLEIRAIYGIGYKLTEP
jgi:two-component system response regulator ArlR